MSKKFNLNERTYSWSDSPFDSAVEYKVICFQIKIYFYFFCKLIIQVIFTVYKTKVI